MNDFKQRFLFNDLAIRGEFCSLDDSIKTFFAKRELPAAIEKLVAESILCSVLLSSTLKFEGKLSIQAQSTDMSNIIFAECSHEFNFRALTRNASDSVDWLKSGQCVVTISPEKGQRYQGIIPLDSLSMPENIIGYLQQSEQLDSYLHCFFNADDTLAAALLLQKLPGADTEDEDGWNRVTQLASTLTQEEALTWDTEILITRLFSEEDVTLYESDTVSFRCQCSRSKLLDAFRQFSAEDIRDLYDEDKKIHSECEFCHAQYCFDAVEIEEFIITGNITNVSDLQ